MGKLTAIKKAYTLIEMLLVIWIVSILSLSFIYLQNKVHEPSSLIIYNITSLIETARFNALEKQKKINLIFEKNYLCLNGQNFFENSGLIVNNPQTVTFNEKGHITKGCHIDLNIQNESYQLIFNVGEGAFHLEKNSFCFTGCTIWCMGLFFCLYPIIWLFNRFNKKNESMRRKHHGKHSKMAGTSLLEALFALSINALILLSMSSLFSHLHKALTLQNNHDIAYAILNLTEDVNTSMYVKTDLDTMTLIYPDQTMTYYLDDGRLVKKPGFDIYLHHIDEIIFDNDGKFVYLYLKRGNQSEKFQIGVFFRPSQQGICESDSSLDAELFNDYFNEPYTNN